MWEEREWIYIQKKMKTKIRDEMNDKFMSLQERMCVCIYTHTLIQLPIPTHSPNFCLCHYLNKENKKHVWCGGLIFDQCFFGLHLFWDFSEWSES